MTRNLLPDEIVPHTNEDAQVFYEHGPRAGSVPGQSTKVGWTLRDGKGRVVDAFAFLINPQGLTRTDGSRAQLFATKGGHYVDDFGPAATAIQLRQLVASGRVERDGFFYTAREDVKRFLTTIYLPATAGVGRTKYRVFFHDHHFDRGHEELVFFPPNSLALTRSVEQHNLWALDLQMTGLEKYPYAEVEAEDSEPRTRSGRRYVCKQGDTIEKLVRRLAGKKASAEKRRRVRQRLLALNPQLKKARVLSDGRLAKPLILHTGEIIRLPAA